MLMVLSTTMVHIAPLTSVSVASDAPANGSTTLFNGTHAEVDLRTQGEHTLIPHVAGTRITGAELAISGQAASLWENQSFNPANQLFINGVFDSTTLGSSGIELVQHQVFGNGSVPGAGTQNLTLLNPVTWNGTHAFDVLLITCGIVAPCGQINADGPLTIIANEIFIEQGGAIRADDLVWGGFGRGTNGRYGYTTPTGVQTTNHGAGGAGHGGAGGDGGNAGSIGGGGQSYGNGSEAGSSGGNVTDMSQNVRAVGGQGGGRINLVAASITIRGIVSANGEDGEHGASLGATGSGPGNHGAGGGSGGGISIQTLQLNISQYGQISATGGDGGTGSVGQAGSQFGWGPNNPGGHGGGAGAGGRISITTLVNGLSNQGTIALSGGGGGAGASGSGTGSTGSSGANGSVGNLSSTTFSGWSGSAGIPGAGTTSLNLNTTLSLSGNHAYDVLHLTCQGGTAGSCGQIQATGPLRISANQITLDVGTSIVANHLVWGGSGIGGTGVYSNSNAYAAGGGGHGGRGGSGGGASSQNGGGTYGNGSESGSSGGNVSSSTNSWYGGKGGGFIELVAGTVSISGLISADGGNGDNGPRSQGGPGLPGAGGGSGGSIRITADTVTLTSRGSISSQGGDGGDGSNAVPNQLTITKDGGDGGGGGGGGRIIVITVANAFTNQGTISVTGGAGGAYGTGAQGGRNGVQGTGGGTGVFSTGTFGGFGATVATIHALDGSWTSPIQTSTMIHHQMTHAFTTTIPGGTNLTAEILTSMDGTNWSGWESLSLTGSGLEPMRFYQLRLSFSSDDGSDTPLFSGFSTSRMAWAVTESLNLSLSSMTGSHSSVDWESSNALFKVEDVISTGAGTTFSDELLVPLNGNPIDSAWLHYRVDQIGSGRVNLSVDGQLLLSMAASEIPNDGLSLRIPHTLLTSAWPTSGTTDASGITWGMIRVDREVGTGTILSPILVSLPYDATFSVGGSGELLTGVERIANLSGGWQFATGLAAFLLAVDGSAASPSQSVTLHDLNITWVDDIAPRLDQVWLEVGGQTVSSSRVNDIVSIHVKDVAGESNLSVSVMLVDIGSGAELWSTPLSLSRNPSTGIWSAAWDTGALDSAQNYSLGLNVSLVDSAQNARVHEGIDLLFEVLPAMPEVASLSLNSFSGAIYGNAHDSRWRHQEEITFSVGEVNNRSDLSVHLAFTQAGGGSSFDLPLVWNDDSLVYVATWTPGRDGLGPWDLEIVARDETRGDVDADGWNAGTDALLRLVDVVAPTFVDISFDWHPSEEGVWRTSVEWLAEQDESVQLTLVIKDETDTVIEQIAIDQTTDRMGSVDWDTSALQPGRYFFDVHLVDESGNIAPEWSAGPDGELVIDPPRVMTIEVLDPAENSAYIQGDVVTIQIDISCSDGCQMELVEEGLSGLSNGTITLNRTLDTVGDILYEFTLRFGEDEVSTALNLSASAPYRPTFGPTSCTEESETYTCEVKTVGGGQATVRTRIIHIDDLLSCTPTEPVTIEGLQTYRLICSTQGEVLEPVDPAVQFILEWQDSEGEWQPLGSEHDWTIHLAPEEGDAEPSEKSDEGFVTNAPFIIAIALILVVISTTTTLLLLRRSKHENELEDEPLEVEYLTGSVFGENEAAQTEEHESSQTEDTEFDKVDSYLGLPPGGEYQTVPEGQWYVDPEGGYWWREPDDGWTKRT
jgi:hypothetical protein